MGFIIIPMYKIFKHGTLDGPIGLLYHILIKISVRIIKPWLKVKFLFVLIYLFYSIKATCGLIFYDFPSIIYSTTQFDLIACTSMISSCSDHCSKGLSRLRLYVQFISMFTTYCFETKKGGNGSNNSWNSTKTPRVLAIYIFSITNNNVLRYSDKGHYRKIKSWTFLKCT